MRLFFVILAVFLLAAAPAEAHRDVIPGPIAGEVVRVLDGDTVAVRVHVWIGEDIETHVRLAGIDAPELHGKCGKERRMAVAARDALVKMAGDKIELTDIRLEKYAGRVMAHAATPDVPDISARMVAEGFARPYHGEKRGAWCGI